MTSTPDASRLHGRFHLLLGVLTLLFFLAPLFQLSAGSIRLFGLLFGIVIIVALYDLSHNRRILVPALLLGVPALGARIMSFATESSGLLLIGNVFLILFVGLVIVAVCQGVVGRGSSNRDRIVGAICVYLLIGLAFATIYSAIELADPGSFRFPDDDLRAEAGPLVRGAEHSFFYFSFVTLTTLGYGDISPITPMSRTISWMEAVVGVLFVAVTIARLVSLSTTT